MPMTNRLDRMNPGAGWMFQQFLSSRLKWRTGEIPEGELILYQTAEKCTECGHKKGPTTWTHFGKRDGGFIFNAGVRTYIDVVARWIPLSEVLAAIEDTP